MTKMCVDREHKTRYQCARCARTYCFACDRAADASEVITVVRFCPDWRCQREKNIEEGRLLIVVAKSDLRDALKRLHHEAGRDWLDGVKSDTALDALENARRALEVWKP